jgi:hypothetical protein
MQDYIKILEERVEDLQERLTIAKNLLQAFQNDDKILSYTLYSVGARKRGQEWTTWGIWNERKNLFKSVNSFKATLNEYDQMCLAAVRHRRVPADEYADDITSRYKWEHDNKWKIYLCKQEKTNLWTIESFAVYHLSYEENSSMEEELLDKHLIRWLK